MSDEAQAGGRRAGRTQATLALIDALRDRGAVEVEVDGVKARWTAPLLPKASDDEKLEPAAAKEYEARLARGKRKNQTLEERLLKPLGIRRPT